MKPSKNTIATACAAMAVLALVLSACGGGGGPATTVPTVALPAGHGIFPDTYAIPAGETRVIGNVEATCPNGEMDCVLTVPSSTAGTANYDTMGAVPTVKPALASVNLPTGHAVSADTHTIQPGETRALGNVEVSCPGEGMACVLTVESATAMTGSYRRTGGTPTVEPALASVDLPAGHAVPADTYTIQPGDTRGLGNVDVSCPDDGMACVLTIASNDAMTGNYQRTGGEPDVEPSLASVGLPTGHAIPADTYTIQPGDTRMLGKVDVSCPRGDMACVLTVASNDAATGTFQLTGGEPAIESASNFVALPTGHAIPADTYTVRAGVTDEYGNVMISCPAGGMPCVLNVASPTASSGTYEATGGTPTVEPVLVDLGLPAFHGIASNDDVEIQSGGTHHGRHGISVACPAGGAECVANFTNDEGEYHKTGGTPEILTHALVRAANDQEGRAYSIFTRDQEDVLSTQNPVGYHLGNVIVDVTRSGGTINFELDYPSPRMHREDRGPTLLDGLISPDHGVDDSNNPELRSVGGAPAWTGVALTREDSAIGHTIHANVYSDIEPDRLGTADTDYLVLGVWLEVPDDINLNTSLLGVFAHGSHKFRSINGVVGAATYQGPATGIYETRESGSSDDIGIGSFVASAELTADFDSDKVTGEVRNFTENGQSLGNWIVDLDNNTGIVPVLGRDIHGNPQISRDGGVSFAGAGELEAGFYGDSTTFPSAVAGSFWSDVGSRDRLPSGDEGYLSLTGAFGAYYCSPPCQ